MSPSTIKNEDEIFKDVKTKNKHKEEKTNLSIYNNFIGNNLTNNLELNQSEKTNAAQLEPRPNEKLKIDTPSTLQLLFPHHCCRKQSSIIWYHAFSKKIFKNLNVKNIINKVVEIEEIQNFVFDRNQKILFNYLTGNYITIDENEIQKAWKNCIDKVQKDHIDTKIIINYNK